MVFIFLLLTSHSQFSPGFSCRNLLCFIICFCYAVDVSSIFFGDTKMSTI
jgi:hypothetical protein